MDLLGSWKWRCLRVWRQKPSSSSSSAPLGLFVLLVEDLHQVLGHEIWFLCTAVITLQILHCTTETWGYHCKISCTLTAAPWIMILWRETLTEAQEQCVHTHVIHAEEAVSDQIRTEHHRLLAHKHTLHTSVQITLLPLPD